jgi:hypothetical protein
MGTFLIAPNRFAFPLGDAPKQVQRLISTFANQKKNILSVVLKILYFCKA